MSRKSRGKKKKQAVPEEILAEGSGPVEGAVVHVGIDTIAADEPEPIITDGPATVEELAAAVEELEAAAASADPDAEAIEVEALAADALAAGALAHAHADDAHADDAHADDAVADEAHAADALAADALAEDPAADPAAEALGAAPDALEELTDEEAAEMGAVLPTSAATMDSVQLRHLVEALVFASDKPMTMVRLRQLTRVSDVRRLEHALTELADDYKERGIVLQQVSGGYQFRTRTQFSSWVQQLIAGRPVRLSRAQLETLAIIAYRQPITRPEIDEIRGVDSSATLKLLLDRSLIRILGKKEEVGRPMLYGTTKEFLDFFSLGDLRELPTLREYSELTDESRRVMSDELGIDADAEEMPEETEEPVEAEPSVDDMLASYAASIDESPASEDAPEADAVHAADGADAVHATDGADAPDAASAGDAADASDAADAADAAGAADAADASDAPDGSTTRALHADGADGDEPAMQPDVALLDPEASDVGEDASAPKTGAPDDEPMNMDAADDEPAMNTDAADDEPPVQVDATDDEPPVQADAADDEPSSMHAEAVEDEPVAAAGGGDDVTMQAAADAAPDERASEEPAPDDGARAERALDDRAPDADASDEDAPTMQVHVEDEAARTGVFHVAAATASLESLAARRMAADAGVHADASEALDSAAADADLADEGGPAGVEDDAPDDASDDMTAATAEDEASEGDALVAADATVADLHEAAKHKHDSSTTE